MSDAPGQNPPPAHDAEPHPPGPRSKNPKKRKRLPWWRMCLELFVVFVAMGCIIRPMLPWMIRSYVNRTLDHNLDYQGKIGDVVLDLWKGSYSIYDIRLLKKTGNVPEPLFRAKRLELAVQWNAILHGKAVGKVVMDEPEVNFVDASDESEGQTGGGGPWLKTLEDLFPFKLNSLEIHNGSIHFHSYKRSTPVDVYLNNLEARVDDLTNVQDQTTPLLTTVEAKGLAMNQAPFEFKMKLDPFSYQPTFEMATRLIGLDVTKTNDLARTYGRFAFKSGWFDIVVRASASEGQLTGYATPLFRNLQVFDVIGDLGDDNPVQYFWQAVLGVTTTALKNQSRDQFGTSIPFTGDMETPNADILATVGNVLRNAFIRAYLPKLRYDPKDYDELQFSPASITDPTSVGETQ